jgi:CRP-like cAMP-binding protein
MRESKDKKWSFYFESLKRQDWESARRALEKMLEDGQKEPGIFVKMGDLHRRTGESIKAVSSYHKAAGMFMSRSLHQRALTVYKIILQLDPYDQEATNRSRELMMELACQDSSPPYAGISPERSGSFMSEFDELTVPASERTKGPIVPEFLTGLPEEELKEFMNMLEPRSFTAREKIVGEGDSGDSMFIVKSGRARVTAHILGKEIELARLGEGDVFGEVAFLTGRPRTASVIAEGPVEVYEISRADLEKTIENNPGILETLENFYERRVKDTIRKVVPEQ